MKNTLAFIFVFAALLCVQSFMPNPDRNQLVMDGNHITVSVFNYGSYSCAGNHKTDFVWQGLGYAYECGFFFGAEVPVPEGSHPDVIAVQNGDSVHYIAHVISDGLTSHGPEMNPDNDLHWGFEPIRYAADSTIAYFDPDRFAHLPTSRGVDFNLDAIPDYWPEEWFDQTLNRYYWPGIWQEGQALGDLETIYGMDDRNNKEFAYYPFVQDSDRQGLGLEVEVHPVQVQDFYQDILFAVINVTNISDYDLTKMLLGFFGDPHIGGWPDYGDDHYGYDEKKHLIYAYDGDGKSYLNPEITPGYFGVLFLQTPGNSSDNIDNDGDGMIDESQWDGIDNDGDWNAQTDDLGADGIANTGDYGEGDGQPTLGEPDFEFTDPDEADMVGLTSAMFPAFGNLYIYDDEAMWQTLTPGNFDSQNYEGDREMLGGSGYFNLPAGQTARIVVAFVFGQNLDDLLANCDRAKRFYSYRLGNYFPIKTLIPADTLVGKTFRQTMQVNWQNSTFGPNVKAEYAVSADNGSHWQPLQENVRADAPATLDIRSLPSWPFYKLRARAFDDHAYYEYQTPGFFAIDNSGEENVAPGLIVYLQNNTILSDNLLLKWQAADVDGDPLHTYLIIQSDVVADTLTLHGDSLLLNTRAYPNGTYRFIFKANDGQSVNEVERTVFIQNEYNVAQGNLVQHVQGPATGKVFVQLVNSSQFKFDLYKITFDSKGGETVYSVMDSTTGEVLIDNDPLPASGDAGRTFNGFRLSFQNDHAELDTTKTGWNHASVTNLNYHLIPGSGIIYPYDIVLRFYDHVVDTSIINFKLLTFKAINLTSGESLGVYVIKRGDDTTHWQAEDNLILTKNKKDLTKLWTLNSEFPEGETPIPPEAGDEYTVCTKKPFAKQDVFLFDAAPLTALEDNRELPKQLVLQQNFPNPFNPQTTIRFSLARPGKVRLTVFNVLGQKVGTLLDKTMQAGQHQIVFDGSRLASGIYWYRLEAGNFTQVKKMILLK